VTQAPGGYRNPLGKRAFSSWRTRNKQKKLKNYDKVAAKMLADIAWPFGRRTPAGLKPTGEKVVQGAL
jgi:hypothetical protein